MERLAAQPSLAQQVYDAIVDEICRGALETGAHLVQEQLAERLGVSRQPIQQAMALLKADGLVVDIGKRGVQVVPLDPELMRHHYDIRAALDGLAARFAARRAAASTREAYAIDKAGRDILRQGEKAIGAGAQAELIHLDAAFHGLIYERSGNPLLARTAEPHWRFLRRAMGEVLRQAELPREIWRQHAAILAAVVAGDEARAEHLAIEHDLGAAESLHRVLAGTPQDKDKARKTGGRKA